MSSRLFLLYFYGYSSSFYLSSFINFSLIYSLSCLQSLISFSLSLISIRVSSSLMYSYLFPFTLLSPYPFSPIFITTSRPLRCSFPPILHHMFLRFLICIHQRCVICPSRPLNVLFCLLLLLFLLLLLLMLHVFFVFFYYTCPPVQGALLISFPSPSLPLSTPASVSFFSSFCLRFKGFLFCCLSSMVTVIHAFLRSLSFLVLF